MTRRQIFIASLLTVAGTAQLLVSHQTTGWVSNVLINTGTATALLVPLFLAQRQLEARVQRGKGETTQEVAALAQAVETTRAEVAASLEELRSGARRRVAGIQEADAEAYD